MLPSSAPLTFEDVPEGQAYRLRGGGGAASVPVRTSIGSHNTVRKKDAIMAQKYKHAHETRSARREYWNSNIG
jgi:hypothetical protein